MRTTLKVAQANCGTCFTETLEMLRGVDGVHEVHGSSVGPRIDIDHDDDVTASTLTAVVRAHLHGFETFSNEITMVPVDPVNEPLVHHHGHGDPTSSTDTPIETRPEMSHIQTTMTLAEIVTQFPSSAGALERQGLDYCCHGARTLEVAATDLGLDPQTVANELSSGSAESAPAEWASMGPSDLVDHIESVHHRYLWDEMPRLEALVDKIVTVHGDRHPELTEVQRLYRELRADFEPHLRSEEEILFPGVRQLDATPTATNTDTQQLAELTVSIAEEHEVVGELLEELRRITDGFTPPADGCASYQACYRGLADLESDTHLHVHKENNILLPEMRRRWLGAADVGLQQAEL